MGKIRVIHIINSLTFGGAEAMLCNLLLRTDRTRFEPSVAALIDDMRVATPLTAAGIPISVMGMKPGVPDPRGLARLALHLRREKPQIVQTWMDHSNLIGGLAARAATNARIVWGIHHSNHVKGVSKRSTLMTVDLCGRLSHRLPTRIICCSEHARNVYVKSGFCDERMTVIPNGFDVSAFKPDAAARNSVRRELGIDGDAPIVAMIGRYDPFKDHCNFLNAAKVVAERFPAVRFVLCGAGVDSANTTLVAKIESFGLGSRCQLLGARRDMARIYAAIDVLASSSFSEAFPLVVGEAMSCGIPCAVTNVGDSALIVGDTGLVVPPSASPALAAAICQLISMGSDARTDVGLRARRRVRELFDLDAVTRRYEALYDELLERDLNGNSSSAVGGIVKREQVPV